MSSRVTASASRKQPSSAAAAEGFGDADDDVDVMAAVVPRRMALLAATFPAMMVATAPAIAAADGENVEPVGIDGERHIPSFADDAAAEPTASATDPAAAAVNEQKAAADENDVMVGDVKLIRYRDETSGWSIGYPEQWSKDQPKANTPEFHPKSEYGGRRFRVEVLPVGRVSGGSNRMAALAESESEEMRAAGYESPRSYAVVEATKFAPVDAQDAAGAAKVGPGSAVSQIITAESSPDGRYYYYEYRVESIYPLHFWGVSALGPGQQGGARKLGRRDVVSVVCQMPEDKATPEDYQLLKAIVDSFRVDDF